MPNREEDWKICGKVIQDVLGIVKSWLFDESILIMYKKFVINKVYVLVCIYFTWCLFVIRCVLSFNSLKGVDNKILW